MRRAQTWLSLLTLTVLCVLMAGCGSAVKPGAITPHSTAAAPIAPPPPTVFFASTAFSSDGTVSGVTMHALNSANGSELWSKALSQTSMMNVAGAGSAVYAVDPFGAIMAMSPADGHLLWQVKGHNAADGQPVADVSALYVGSTGDSSNHGYIDAYSATDGSVRWEHDLGVLMTLNLTVAQGILYVSTQNTVMALRTTDGSVVWTASVPWGSLGTPAVIGSAVYLNALGDVRAFDASNGSLLWHHTPDSQGGMGDDIASGAAGLVFVGFNSTLVALHVADGTIAWSTPLGRMFNGTSAFDNVVYAAPATTLVALDAATGATTWNVTLRGSGDAPILSNGMLFERRWEGATQQPQGYIYALKPADGSVVWSLTNPDEVYSSITLI